MVIGVMPFLIYTPAYAHVKDSTSAASKWFDDYRKPVGFTYGLSATVNANYLWRGLYAGGLSFQPDANVGYGGLYADMWWSLGATDWVFRKFQPEVDVTIGFARWGLDVYVLYIHNFDCNFFDFRNYPSGGSCAGNRLEIDVKYTLSSKIPLTITWATRVAASDGYTNAAGDTIRAYSSYAEISYTHHLPYEMSISAAVGLTPWKSLYTGYQRDFAVCNVSVGLRKDWSLSEHCGLMLRGLLVINPSALAADQSTAQWKPASPGAQSVNANIGVGVYWK